MPKKLKIEKSRKKSGIKMLNCSDRPNELNKISGANIEIIGNSYISIDGCLGVCEYNSDYINLKLVKGSLIISGVNFDITFFENRLITVKGKISSLEFAF